MANPDAKDTPHPPPNLRVSDDENKECDSCRMFTRRQPVDPFDGRCTGYSLLPVCGEWVCDSYDKAGPDDDQPTTLAEARIRVKEHYRRARRAQQ